MAPTPTCRPGLAALLAVPLLVLAGCADAPIPVAPDAPALVVARQAGNQPVRLAFNKCIVDPVNGVWEGSVTGDVVGALRTELTALRVTGPIWHVRFDWIIRAGGQSLVADLSGILNTNTGKVVMNGRVADGYLQGARVHEQGQLVDPARSCFTGTIRIMPATAR